MTERLDSPVGMVLRQHGSAAFDDIDIDDVRDIELHLVDDVVKPKQVVVM